MVILADTFRSAINYVQQNLTPFYMAQEPVANAPPLMCALNQTGNIGNYELLVIDLRHPETRVKCCKSVIGDFRRRIGRLT